MTLTPRTVLGYEDAEKPAALVEQSASQVSSLTAQLKQSDFWERLEQLRTAGGAGSGNFGHAGRPGEVGGSSTLGHTAAEMRARRLPETLEDAENRIRFEKNEHGFVEKDGRIIAYFGDDHSSQIDLTKEIHPAVIGTPKDPLRDAIFTHNHPGNSGLSPSDVFVAASHNVKEFRAVVDNGVHSIERIGDGWPNPVELVDASIDESDGVREIFNALIQQGSITTEKANREHWPQVWKRVADKVNTPVQRIRVSFKPHGS